MGLFVCLSFCLSVYRFACLSGFAVVGVCLPLHDEIETSRLN